MKYLDRRFSSPANSKAFVDNWDAVFGKDAPAERARDADDAQDKSGPVQDPSSGA